jgi:hypothetical protein
VLVSRDSPWKIIDQNGRRQPVTISPELAQQGSLGSPGRDSNPHDSIVVHPTDKTSVAGQDFSWLHPA